MKYLFNCLKCGCDEEKEIPIADYDKLKNYQVCSNCGGDMKRVIEWEGLASNLGGYSEVAGMANWQTGGKKK